MYFLQMYLGLSKHGKRAKELPEIMVGILVLLPPGRPGEMKNPLPWTIL
jgi:hypothetical protein